MLNFPSDFDTARAIRDAQNGSIVAKVALNTVLGEPTDPEWPAAFRQTALDTYRAQD